MKELICTFAGCLGALIAKIYGGWDSAMTTLLIVMSIDYISGLAVAGIFKKSSKTDSGALSSRAGFKGPCRKVMELLIVLVAYRIDLSLGVSYVKDASIIAFIVNEIISITENAGLMGVPLPKAITRAIDVLTDKEESLNK